MPKMVTVVATFAGLLLGCASAGAFGWYLLRSRSFRKMHNRFVIRLGQVLALISIGGGLFLIQVFDKYLGIKGHSPPYYAALWAYLGGFICVAFFALRADLLWQKSVGLSRKT
jgi:drug/metabolite transporter (DMT)-like permease